MGDLVPLLAAAVALQAIMPNNVYQDCLTRSKIKLGYKGQHIAKTSTFQVEYTTIVIDLLTEESPSHCIFVADDDEDDRFLLRLAFQQQSPQSVVLFAVDGLELLSALADPPLHPCLIILDLNMPRLNGLEALKALRQVETYRATPIVILTTSDDAFHRQQAYDLGANGYLVKPLSLDLLVKIVGKLVADWNLTH